MSMERLKTEVIELEWNMFTNVQNEGCRASCQDDRATFEIMRGSQFAVWSEAALQSWKEDLEQARKRGRNLMAEKYAYMMQDTAPEQFEKIKHLLPEFGGEAFSKKQNLVQELTEMQVRWKECVETDYPFLKQRGRALRKSEAYPGDASLETYASGELMTHSQKTLELLKLHFEEMERQGMNPGICILEDMVRRYGYADLKEAQEYMGK